MQSLETPSAATGRQMSLSFEDNRLDGLQSPERDTGSSIQPAIEITTPVGPCT